MTYGQNLPIFHTPSSPMTEDQVERCVERYMDRADAALMRGDATQAEYDAWTNALSRWADRHTTRWSPALTLNTAKAWVIAQHAALGEAADVEGCGFIERDTVRLNVSIEARNGAKSCCQWDVFEDTSGALRGFYIA